MEVGGFPMLASLSGYPCFEAASLGSLVHVGWVHVGHGDDHDATLHHHLYALGEKRVALTYALSSCLWARAAQCLMPLGIGDDLVNEYLDFQHSTSLLSGRTCGACRQLNHASRGNVRFPSASHESTFRRSAGDSDESVRARAGVLFRCVLALAAPSGLHETLGPALRSQRERSLQRR